MHSMQLPQAMHKYTCSAVQSYCQLSETFMQMVYVDSYLGAPVRHMQDIHWPRLQRGAVAAAAAAGYRCHRLPHCRLLAAVAHYFS